MGTILTALVLLGIITAIIFKIFLNRKKGCAGCGCNRGAGCGLSEYRETIKIIHKFR